MFVCVVKIERTNVGYLVKTEVEMIKCRMFTV